MFLPSRFIQSLGTIESSLNSVPWLLKTYYISNSFIFCVGYIIEGFESELLYIIVLAMVTVIIVFSYVIIFDLDQPLAGFVRVDIARYDNCADYIKRTKHQIDSLKKYSSDTSN